MTKTSWGLLTDLHREVKRRRDRSVGFVGRKEIGQRAKETKEDALRTLTGCVGLDKDGVLLLSRQQEQWPSNNTRQARQQRGRRMKNQVKEEDGGGWLGEAPAKGTIGSAARVWWMWAEQRKRRRERTAEKSTVVCSGYFGPAVPIFRPGLRSVRAARSACAGSLAIPRQPCPGRGYVRDMGLNQCRARRRLALRHRQSIRMPDSSAQAEPVLAAITVLARYASRPVDQLRCP